MTSVEFVIWRGNDRLVLDIRGVVEDGQVSIDDVFLDGATWSGTLTDDEAEEALDALAQQARDDAEDWERSAGEELAFYRGEA